MRSEINKFQTLDEFREKFEEIKTKNRFKVEQIPWSAMNQWEFKNEFSSLEHSSGKFFKIEGLKVKTNYGKVQEWEQPIINQPEIGVLGILSKVFDDTRYYLMQAKMEPGNVNTLQLSPTLQATKSNFSRVHNGNSPAYLDYFLDREKSNILIDLLLSEQGGKFIKKRNRNMVIDVQDEVEVLDGFFWLTLADLKTLIKEDNFINMDARSVISTIPIVNIFDTGVHKLTEIFTWFNDQKVKYELQTEKVSLRTINGWAIDDFSIFKAGQRDRFFSVIAVKVEAGTREVTSWTQPMIKDENVGLIGFLRKDISGEPHYLVQTKVMPGNIDIVDISPTVSISNFKYVENIKDIQPLFFNYFLNPRADDIIYGALQSEEGGRFYNYQNFNTIIKTDDDIEIPDNYKWVSYDQLILLMNMGYTNIETRSLIAAIQ